MKDIQAKSKCLKCEHFKNYFQGQTVTKFDGTPHGMTPSGFFCRHYMQPIPWQPINAREMMPDVIECPAYFPKDLSEAIANGKKQFKELLKKQARENLAIDFEPETMPVKDAKIIKKPSDTGKAPEINVTNKPKPKAKKKTGSAKKQ